MPIASEPSLIDETPAQPEPEMEAPAPQTAEKMERHGIPLPARSPDEELEKEEEEEEEHILVPSKYTKEKPLPEYVTPDIVDEHVRKPSDIKQQEEEEVEEQVEEEEYLPKSSTVRPVMPTKKPQPQSSTPANKPKSLVSSEDDEKLSDIEKKIAEQKKKLRFGLRY